ncbi:hypothetical protein TOPH_08747 [Tolypocladium ophioglossoides CBS 100239]|uniref:Uncharacterized protein n=1 Tax=Tolypocladium ophioglossoides (strain CBS 100239) TaxID=1163406 RepID=A0A0L0MYP2_TOLOC|nr:hypothetical protein TOPH_08747 [Tolypocladium ophioglossoides CBS 100239]
MPKKASSSEPCSSSTLLEPVPSSSLRARLRSQEPTPKVQSTSPNSWGPSEHTYQRFRACFVDPGSDNLQLKDTRSLDGEDDALARLQGAFADAGLELYTSVAEEIVQAHGATESQIAGLSDKSSAVLSQADALYSNIAYPLSATLCHADSLPSATIATHLSTLRNQLSAAQDELRELQQEWEACLREEQQAWKELNSDGAEKRHYLRNGKNTMEHEIERFKAEAQSILRENEEALDDIDNEFRELVHGEVMKAAQNMKFD